MPIIIVVLGIFALILLIAFWRFNAFLAFIIVAFGVGLAEGMSSEAVSASVQKGLGNTLGSLALILGFGAIIGKTMAESGAAQSISDHFTTYLGKQRVRWALMLAGFFIGIPMFFAVGFVILVPIVFTLAASTRLPIIYVALPMVAALSVTHGLLPPHPAPTSLVEIFHADMGKTLVYGFVIGVPCILIAGLYFSRYLKQFNPKPLKAFYDPDALQQHHNIPSFSLSLTVAVLPVFLMILASVSKAFIAPDTPGSGILNFIGDPVVALLITALIAMYFLLVRRGVDLGKAMTDIGEAMKEIAPILLIIGGAGALNQVLADSGVSTFIAHSLKGIGISALILGWGIAALIRISVGSATVAALTTAGIIAPLAVQQGVDPNLMVISLGAGSLIFSHVNDGGFWLFKEYFNLSVADTFKTWTAMETIIAFVGLIFVLLINAIF